MHPCKPVCLPASEWGEGGRRLNQITKQRFRKHMQNFTHKTMWHVMMSFVSSCLPHRLEQCRLSAAGEGVVCERQLDVGWRTVGSGQHRNWTETRLRDTLTSLQARPVHPLEQTVPQGEGRHLWRRSSGWDLMTPIHNNSHLEALYIVNALQNTI